MMTMALFCSVLLWCGATLAVTGTIVMVVKLFMVGLGWATGTRRYY